MYAVNAVVEFKVKSARGIMWEDIPVMVSCGLASRRYETQKRHADSIASAIGNAEDCVEVRWNFQGRTQGHYVAGKNYMGGF